ncbi:MAG: hypothetical protein ACOY9C_00785 [Pseudomonadota bacterium]
MTGRRKRFEPCAFPDLPFDEALQLAALRVRYDRLVEDQEEFLEDAARRWLRVRRLRAFLDAVEDRCAGKALTADVRSWLAWGRARCEDLDPLSASGREALQAYAAALQSPPDLPPRHPEEEDWLDAGLLDEFLDADGDEQAP